MPTLLTTILATTALLGVPFALFRASRRAALIVDFVLFGLLVGSHFPPLYRTTMAGPFDIVTLVLILSFHEFSSIHSDAARYESNFSLEGDDEVNLSDIERIRLALIHRSLSAAGLLLAAAVISEAYFLAAQGASASLYSIYGVAGGLMVVMAFLFLFLTVTSRKPQK